jgi:hypothetical protein
VANSAEDVMKESGRVRFLNTKADKVLEAR